MILSLSINREVFWDDYLADSNLTTAQKRLGTPVKRECVFEFDEGNERMGLSYPHIVKVDGKYRLYYISWNPYEENAQFDMCCCVIESEDGINWTKPELNIYDRPELKKNNVVMTNVLDNMFVFYDTNPDCPKEEKFKALIKECIDHERPNKLWCFTSADGYHFERSHMITDHGYFDTLNTACYKDGKYYCFIRSFHNVTEREDINFAIRDVRVLTSNDFKNWTEPKELKYNDDLDYGVYTNNVVPYERAPHIFVGFPTRYHIRHEWTKNALQMKSCELKKSASVDMEARIGLCTTDAMFMSSRDGENWYRYNQAFLTPGYENDHNWIYGDCYLTYNMIDSGEENFWMYCHDYTRNKDHHRKLYRYEIRKDGFAYYEATDKECQVVTKPFTFSGKELHINFETSPFGHIFIEVLSESGETLATSEEIYGNTIDRMVYLDDGRDFSDFINIPIKLRFTMLDAKLYSIKFE